MYEYKDGYNIYNIIEQITVRQMIFDRWRSMEENRYCCHVIDVLDQVIHYCVFCTFLSSLGDQNYLMYFLLSALLTLTNDQPGNHYHDITMTESNVIDEGKISLTLIGSPWI